MTTGTNRLFSSFRIFNRIIDRRKESSASLALLKIRHFGVPAFQHLDRLSGRKPKAHGKSYTLKSTPEVDAFLSSYEGDKTEFINLLLFFCNIRLAICSSYEGNKTELINRAILALAEQSPLSKP